MLREMADFVFVGTKVQGDPDTAWCARKDANTKIMWTHKKGTDTKQKNLPFE